MVDDRGRGVEWASVSLFTARWDTELFELFLDIGIFEGNGFVWEFLVVENVSSCENLI